MRFFAGLAIAGKKLVDAFRKQAIELESFSGDIAGARATNRANILQARLNRGQRLGPELARIELARGRVDEQFFELQTKIYEQLLKFTPLIEGVLAAVETSTDIFGQLIEDADPTRGPGGAVVGGIFGGIPGLLGGAALENRIKAIISGDDEADPTRDPVVNDVLNWNPLGGKIQPPNSMPAPMNPPGTLPGANDGIL